MKLRTYFLLTFLLIAVLVSPVRVLAAPVAPVISIVVTPTLLIPAEAGTVYVGGAYPLVVEATLDDQPLDVFWAGDGYNAVFSFGFDAPAGDHTLHVAAVNPLTGERAEKTETVTVRAWAYPVEQVALPQALIPLLDRDLNQRELDRLNTIYAGRTDLGLWDFPFSIPVPGGIVTSRFGGDRTYNGGMFESYHTGMDFRRHVGDPIAAAADGRVVAAELFEVRGNVIILDHGHGVFSQYAHLSEFFVSPGEYVERGQLIGAAGKTGRTNGPHLHFEVIVNGITVDPLTWLSMVPNFVPPQMVRPDEVPPG